MWALGLWLSFALTGNISETYVYPVKPFRSVLLKEFGIPPNIDYFLAKQKQLRELFAKKSSSNKYWIYDPEERLKFRNKFASFNRFGPPLIPSADLFEAEKYLKTLVEKLRLRFFPDIKIPIDIILTEAGRLATCLFDKESDFFSLSFSRELFSLVETEEQLIWVILHELMEGLRKKRMEGDLLSNDKEFEKAQERAPVGLPLTDKAWKIWLKRDGTQILKIATQNQIKEVQMDTKALQLLAEFGKNPSDAGRVMEHLAFSVKKRPDLLATHPASEGRASALNASAEKLMSLQQFPPLTPLPEILLKLRTKQPNALHVFYDPQSPSFIWENLWTTDNKNLEDFFWSFAAIISFPVAFNDRLNCFQNFGGYRLDEKKDFSFEQMIDKTDSETLEKIIFPLIAKLLVTDLPERPLPRDIRSLFKDQKFQGKYLQKSRILWNLIDLEIQNRYPHFRWISLSQEEENLFNNLILVKNFKDLSRFYLKWKDPKENNKLRYGSTAISGIFSFFFQKHPENILTLIKIYIDFVNSHADELKNILAGLSKEDKQIQKEFVYLKNTILMIISRSIGQSRSSIGALTSDIRKYYFQVTDPWLRVLAFSDLEFSNPALLSDSSSGSLFKQSGSEWVDQIKEIKNIEEYMTAFRQTAVAWISPEESLYSSRSLFKTFIFGLKNFNFSYDEIEALLRESIYWPVVNLTESRKHFPDYFKDDIFWKEKNLSEELQVIIYDRLKELNEFENPGNQFRWWTKFAKQAVTPFTDKWAEDIFDETEAGTKRHRIAIQFWNGAHISSRALRAKIFKEILNGVKKYDAIESFVEGSKERDDAIQTCLLDIFYHFPEPSFERAEALDQVVTRFRSSKNETKLIYSWRNSETDFSSKIGSSNDFNIGLNDGLGTRLLTQVFAELARKPENIRLNFLKFLVDPVLTDFSMEVKGESSNEDENQNLIKNILQYNHYSSQISEPGLFFIKYYFGFDALRSTFKSLHPSVSTVFIDSLMMGPEGLLRKPKSKNKLIDYLFKDQDEWGDLGKDLLEGLRRAVRSNAYSHQDTLIVSFLLATLSNRETEKNHIGILLREFFSASTALTKTGQELHSSGLLPEEINIYLADLKDKAVWISRDEIYDWLLAASTTDPKDKASEGIVIGRVLAVASVKVAVEAWINGVHKVIYIVRPNAVAMGDSSFSILENAVSYAISKGHKELRAILPMLRRGRAVLQRELNLVEERARAIKMSALYLNGPFTSQTYDPIEILPFDPLRVASVDFKDFIPFQDLPESEQLEMATDITEREWNILVENQGAKSSGEIIFDRDRHEKNYLRLAGESDGKKNLVFDPGQLTSILDIDRDRLWKLLEITESYNQGLISKTDFVRELQLNLTEIIDKKIILRAISESPRRISPIRLSVILFNLQGFGATIPDSWLDYLKGLNTVSTWDKYLPQERQIATRIRNRIGRKLERRFKETTFGDKCGIAVRRLFK